MQRVCSKLRFLVLRSTQKLAPVSSSHCLLHSSLQSHLPSQFTTSLWSSDTTFNLRNYYPSVAHISLGSSLLPRSLVQVRHVSSRERAKKRKPMTPVKSKVKKIKMKSYSSYKSRFRTLNDGTIRRWKEGKRHNAHLKVHLFLFNPFYLPIWLKTR
ncbi:uncharacterized protein LOC110825245 [Carica papaya]|uniref:uncharacterized protein LOC110825245 n=1 Tax=Carica papaya TaxID=3649 RepID=UPI000B8D029A|nr:uncharacterized protein LOC110825245 [Carica papaya]